jgi:hypothetical protein
LTVEWLAVALAVGTIVSADVDALVELYAQPFEGLNDIFLGTRDETGLVRVFNAENHIAAILPGEEIVVQSGADSADVERTGGTRCETNADFFHI